MAIRLSRAKFERHYEAMPHLKKAELIEGVVHLVGRGFPGSRASFSIVLSNAMFIPGMFGGEPSK